MPIGLYRDISPWLPKKHELPHFRVTTMGVNVPAPGEKSLSFQDIANRRRHILEISNPNASDLLNFNSVVQLPETALSINAAEMSAIYKVSAEENWDIQPVSVSGDFSSVEPLGIEEHTGLWGITVNKLPATRSVKIEIITTRDVTGDFYSETVSQWNANNGQWVYYLHGSYELVGDSDVSRHFFAVPLAYETAKREIQVVSVLKPELRDLRFMPIQHGRGFRIPGILETRGYLVGHARQGARFVGRLKLERTKDIDAEFGLAGKPPTEPFLWVKFKPKK